MSEDKYIIRVAFILLSGFAGMALLTLIFWVAYNNSHADATQPFAQTTECAPTQKGFKSHDECVAEAALIGLGPEHCVQKK